MQFKVMFYRFPFGHVENPYLTDWISRVAVACKRDPRIATVGTAWIDDTPITLSRNRALKQCLQQEVDLCVMIDSDMQPDLYLDTDPTAKPFWESTFDYWLENYLDRPCCIAAPYCGPPPHEIPYIFRWCTFQSDHPAKADCRLEMFSREEAARRTGFEIVAALPTGLILIDMRALKHLPKPWFDYEYKDSERSEKASTEDVVFTRNCSLLGVDQIVNWDAWAGHLKRKIVGKPTLITSEQVAANFREPLLKQIHRGERVMMVNEGVRQPLPPHLLRQDLAHEFAAGMKGNGFKE